MIVDNARLQERLGASRLIATLRGGDVDATVAVARRLREPELRGKPLHLRVVPVSAHSGVC